MTRFKWKHQNHCLPACHSFNFEVERIYVSIYSIFQALFKPLQYAKLQDEQERDLRKTLDLTDDIELAGAEFQLSEKINRREIETAAYPFTGFLKKLINEQIVFF